jgi:hypothetical protein
MLQFLKNVKVLLEYAGGVIEEPPFPVVAWMKGPLWWGLWWAILIVLIVTFSGQTSKFIYIDF